MDKLETLVTRLETAVTKLEKYERGGTVVSRAVAPAPAAQPAAAAGITSTSSAAVAAGAPVPDIDAIIEAHVTPFMQCASSLGDEILKASGVVERAFKALRNLVDIASRSKKPDDLELQELVTPLSTELITGSKLAEGRRSAHFNHYKTVAEALQAFTFVVYSGPACGMSPPSQLVSECWQSSEFYANKIIMEHKGKVQEHVDWVRLFKEMMTKLQQHVRSFHPTGLKWNPAGGSASAAAASPTPAPSARTPTPPARTPTPTTTPATTTPSEPEPAAPSPAPQAAPAPKPGAPPPPPPPPSAQLKQELAKVGGEASKSGGGGGLDALFSELNKGEGITSGLKKVTDDMKVKNRKDRTGTVPSREGRVTPTPSTGAKSQPPSGEPKVELRQKRWVVEHQVDNKEVVLAEVTPQQVVYIYSCKNSVIQVKGKVNGISLDGCKGTGVVFEDVIASVEAVNCASCQIQFTGKAPTVNFDQCNGMQLYVPPASVGDEHFQVVTAKCSEINVVAIPAEPAEGEDYADPVEHPVPEQFISKFQDGKLITIIATHSGA